MHGLAYPENGRTLAAWLPTVDGMVVVDPGPLVADIPAAVLDVAVAWADWWTCNEREARLGPIGHRGVIVRRGDGGCDVTVDGTTVTVPAFGVDAVDNNGAGDTHVGAFVAALAVTRRGPATAPTLQEVERFLAGHG